MCDFRILCAPLCTHCTSCPLLSSVCCIWLLAVAAKHTMENYLPTQHYELELQFTCIGDRPLLKHILSYLCLCNTRVSVCVCVMPTMSTKHHEINVQRDRQCYMFTSNKLRCHRYLHVTSFSLRIMCLFSVVRVCVYFNDVFGKQ